MSNKNNGFTFKQFHIAHDRCAMKVGTDGILLGAKADITQAKRILDLGTGTGLIALMLAQRTNGLAEISAVEIEREAFLQATENVQMSPWSECIRLYHQDISEFGQQLGQKCGQYFTGFDLVVANPPYFPPGTDCHSEQRNQARYTLQQTHYDWLQVAADCMAEQGRIQFILPIEAGNMLLAQEILSSVGLFCIEHCAVITKAGKPPQRVILTFSKQEAPRTHSQIIIYDENNHYHQDFITLTKDFYLKF